MYFLPNAASLGLVTLGGTAQRIALAATSIAADVLRLALKGQAFYVKFGTDNTVVATSADILIDPREGPVQFIGLPVGTTHVSFYGAASNINVTEGSLKAAA